ncbi:MAG TPA: hypothetical protein VLB29_04565 [Nocardioidaceae bacterium]|nr:hypothetical protein [Nocardioidaceae bacterium]
MTAPGQEPDEVMTAKPDDGTDAGEPTRKPDLDAVGDSHMPDDLREAERERAQDEAREDSEAEGDPAEGDPGEDGSGEERS